MASKKINSLSHIKIFSDVSLQTMLLIIVMEVGFHEMLQNREPCDALLILSKNALSAYKQIHYHLRLLLEYPTCGPESYTCFSGQCIDQNLVCDGIRDCFDSTDEREHDGSIKAECGTFRWICSGL